VIVWKVTIILYAHDDAEVVRAEHPRCLVTCDQAGDGSDREYSGHAFVRDEAGNALFEWVAFDDYAIKVFRDHVRINGALRASDHPYGYLELVPVEVRS